jgi:hypothetical protein
MDLTERIKAFSDLGVVLRDALDCKPVKYSSQLINLIDTQHLKNPWFTPSNVRMAIQSIARELTYENLTRWTDLYPAMKEKRKPICVGLIMAGNIPLAGFHDFLSTLITGNSLIAKTSSKDVDLIRFIGDILSDLNPGFRDKIEFTEGTLSGFDAVIATGSDNSSRYFEYYFGKYPGIIRKNRNSVALIQGDETETELRLLGTDVLSYFGLGCRNISKVYVPRGYDFSIMIKSWDHFSSLTKHIKYVRNYDFNKAVYLVNREKFIDTGFLLLRENQSIQSPVTVLHFENYDSLEEVHKDIEKNREKIQCIVGRNNIPFGLAQSPALWDYADGKDTIEFILKKISAGIL